MFTLSPFALPPFAVSSKKIARIIALSCCCIPFSSYADNAVIDLLIVYTAGTAALYGGDPSTRFNQLVATANQIYSDSGVELELRIANTVQVNYTDTNSANTALEDMTYNRGSAFSTVAGLREVHNADMVVFLRPYHDNHGSCGVAWVGGTNTNGDFSNPSIKNYQYSHVAVNTCGDYVLAHELGHNMGLRHSRKQDGTGGTLPYALGYGIVNNFTTIMAYQSEFNVDYWTGKVYKFSNPELTCMGVPCGIDRNQSNGSDARYALNITGPQVSNYFGGANAQFKTELQLAYEDMNSAKTVYEDVVTALNNSSAAIVSKNATQKSAQADLKLMTTAAKTATKDYQTAVKNYNAAVKAANTALAKANTAQAQYDAAKTATARTKAQQTQQAQMTAYQSWLDKADAYSTQASSLQSALTSASNTLSAATLAYNDARQATSDEKTLNASLKKDVSAKQKIFKALETQYNKLLKLRGASASKMARSNISKSADNALL